MYWETEIATKSKMFLKRFLDLSLFLFSDLKNKYKIERTRASLLSFQVAKVKTSLKSRKDVRCRESFNAYKHQNLFKHFPSFNFLCLNESEVVRFSQMKLRFNYVLWKMCKPINSTDITVDFHWPLNSILNVLL